MDSVRGSIGLGIGIGLGLVVSELFFLRTTFPPSQKEMENHLQLLERKLTSKINCNLFIVISLRVSQLMKCFVNLPVFYYGKINLKEKKIDIHCDKNSSSYCIFKILAKQSELSAKMNKS